MCTSSLPIICTRPTSPHLAFWWKSSPAQAMSLPSFYSSRQSEEEQWACWGNVQSGIGCGRCIRAIAMVGGGGVVEAWRQLAKLGTLLVEPAHQCFNARSGMINWQDQEVCLAVCEDDLHRSAAVW